MQVSGVRARGRVGARVGARVRARGRVDSRGRAGARAGVGARRLLGRLCRLLPCGTLAIWALLLAACSAAPLPYPEQIHKWRADKDAFMRESSQSPVPANRRAAFPALDYFPVDMRYRTPAGLEELPGGPAIEMPTSTGQVRKMRRVGRLSFTLNGRQFALTAFVEADETDMRRLFVPFGDLTNGTETYPGGRYLDLDRTATGIYDLDFNKAYNPFCYYNASYDCPIPPPENRLDITVRAGEKARAHP
jgi:uncharacterized protein